MGSHDPQLVVDVQIEGQASPRWRGAASEAERIENNQRLSEARSNAVEKLTEQSLKNSLAPADLKFQYNLSYPDNASVPDQTVLINASGKGQSESLPAAHGDRRNNDPNFRRVDVRVRVAHRLQENIPRRVTHNYEQSTRTRFWYVSVAMGVSAADIAYAALLFVKLRNQYDQTAIGQALVGGAGVGTGLPSFGKRIPHASAGFGGETSFYTDVPVDFSAFDGIGIRYTSASAGIFLGYKLSWLTFYGLGEGAASISMRGASLGAQFGGQLATGNGVLWLDSVPTGYVTQSYTQTEFDTYKSLWVTDHKAALYFATGSADVLADDRVTLGNMLTQVAKDVFAK